ARHEPLRPERLPELRDVDLERLRGTRGRLLAPELVDEPLGRDDAVSVQQEEREERARLLRCEADGSAVDDRLERPEEPELVHLASILGCWRDVLAPELVRRGAAEEREGEADLVAEELEHVPRSLLAGGGETPEDRTARERRARAERERLHDVGAAPDPAVEV